MAYILHHSTTFHAHGSGYHQIDESGQSPVSHGHALLSGHGNTSVRAAFIHVLGDLLQSVGVMVAATIIYFRVRYRSRSRPRSMRRFHPTALYLLSSSRTRP